MTTPIFDPDELRQLRQQLDRLQGELQSSSSRLGELEQIADRFFAVEATPASVATVPPPLPVMLEIEDVVPTQLALQPPQITPLQPIAAESPSIEPPAAEPQTKEPTPAADDDNYELAPELPRPVPPIRREPPAHRPRPLVPSPMLVEVAADRPQTITPIAPPKAPRKQVDWETLIGGRWMTWVGAFTLLLAVGFAVHWAWSTFQTPPWVQVTGFHLLGVGFLAGSYFARRRGLPITTQALVGLSIFTLYAAAFAALHLYKLWPERVAFVECAGLTVLAIALALYADSPAVVLLGALGGYLTPVLTSSGSGNYVGLFAYLAFLNVALMSCAVWRDWRFLKPLTLVATALMFVAWLLNSHFDINNNNIVWGTQWFAVLHGLIFLTACTVPPLVWKRVSRGVDLFTLAASSLLFVGCTWWLFHNRVGQELALVSWTMSLLHGVLFAITFARVTNVDRMPRVHLALAAVFFTLAIPLQINDAAYWGATWCVEGFVFTAVGLYFRDRQMCATAAIVLLIGAGRLLGWDLQAAPRLIGETAIDFRAAMFFVGGFITLVAGGMYRLIPWAMSREPERDEFHRGISKTLSAIGAALITLSPMLQLHDWIYLGPIWAVEAIVFTVLGIVLRERQFCITGLIVFILAAARLLRWDFVAPAQAFLDTGFDLRAVAFFGTGLLMLLAGGFYRLLPWALSRKTDRNVLYSDCAYVLYALGAALVTLSPLLQLHDWIYLGPIWAIEAIVFTVLGIALRDRQFGITGLLVFGLAGARLIGFDFLSTARTFGETAVDLRFAMFAIAGLLAMLAGGLYRLLPWALRRPPLNDELHRSLAWLISAIGSALVVLAPMLQLHDLTYLGPAWAAEALTFTVLGLLVRDPQMRLTGLLVFLLAGGRLIGFDFLSPARKIGDSSVDLRFGAFLGVGLLALGCGTLYRLVNRRRDGRTQSDDLVAILSRNFSTFSRDDFATIATALLFILGAVLVTRSPPLQLAEFALLGPIWAIEALLFIVLGIFFRDRLLSIIGLAVFLAAAARIVPFDFRAQARLIDGTGWDLRFVAMAISGLLAIAAGGMFWLIPRLLRREKLAVEERIVGAMLAAAGNIILMLAVLCQWDNRLALILWTLDAALIWAAGFRFHSLPLRWYAAALAIGMVGGRVLQDGASLAGSYQLLINSRFISLALVAALYFAAGGMYRKWFGGQRKISDQLASLLDSGVSKLDEAVLDPILGILANAVLLTAISFEIHSWFAAAIAAGHAPFTDMHMAEMAAYSIVWAIYAAVVVALGFALRYPLFRLLGLFAFGPILLKVFFIDLESLRWLPRVLALAVLGLMLMGVSTLYQKFASRTEHRT